MKGSGLLVVNTGFYKGINTSNIPRRSRLRERRQYASDVLLLLVETR